MVGKHKPIKIIFNTGISSIKLSVWVNQTIMESFHLADASQYHLCSGAVSRTRVQNYANSELTPSETMFGFGGLNLLRVFWNFGSLLECECHSLMKFRIYWSKQKETKQLFFKGLVWLCQVPYEKKKKELGCFDEFTIWHKKDSHAVETGDKFEGGLNPFPASVQLQLFDRQYVCMAHNVTLLDLSSPSSHTKGKKLSLVPPFFFKFFLMFPLSCLPLMLHPCAAQVLLVSVVFWLFLWWPVQSSSDFHLKALGTFILWKRKKSKCFLHCCWEANRMRHIVKTHSITEAFFPAYELQYFCAVH